MRPWPWGVAADARELPDLDGHLDLLGDPAAGALPVVAGRLHGPMKAGLGVEIG